MIRQKGSFPGHSHCVYSVAFSPDGSYFASGSLDKTVRIWEIERARQLYRFEEGTDSVRLVGWLDQERLYAGSFSNIIRIYRPFEGLLAGIMHDSSNVIWLEADPKNNILYSLNQTGELSMWCCRKLKKLLSYLHAQAPPTCFVVAQQPFLLYCCFNDKKLGDCNFSSQNPIVSYRAEHNEKINHLEYNPSTDILAAGDDEGSIILFSVTRWEIVIKVSSQLGWIRAGCFINKGGEYVAAGEDGSLLHFSISTGRMLTVLDSHKNWIACLASTAQNQLLSCGQDNNIHYYQRTCKK